MIDQLAKSPQDIIVFALLVSIAAIMLIAGFAHYFFKYKKEKKQVLTLKKIVIFSLFFSFFIFQSLFTRFFVGAPVIPFSLDTITIIAVGFVFGPIEGILYGLTADLTRVMINGWAPQLLPAFAFGLLGLFSGMLGRMYFKRGDEMSDIWAFFGMQAIIVFFAVMSAIAAPVLSFIDPYEYTDATYYTMMVAALLSLIGMEFLLLYARRSENRSYMRLIVFITLINAVDRIFNGYLLRSFSQYWYYGHPFTTQLLQRMITASYLVPARIVASVALVRATIFAIEQKGGIANWT